MRVSGRNPTRCVSGVKERSALRLPVRMAKLQGVAEASSNCTLAFRPECIQDWCFLCKPTAAEQAKN